MKNPFSRKFSSIACMVLLLASALVGGACRSHMMKVPSGFVFFDRETDGVKALSADGVRLKTSRLDNKPRSEAKLWNNALELRLKNQGYRIISKRDFVTETKLKGRMLETLYNVNGRDFTYLTAVFIKDDYIYLVEAAGPYKVFKSHRENIVASLKSFRLN